MAAAIVSVIAFSAVAAIFYHEYSLYEDPIVEQQMPDTTPATAVKVIDFENVPLPTVISKIREVYGVEITDIPDNAADYRLSLHYEGNVADLLETINEILDTKMALKE